MEKLVAIPGFSCNPHESICTKAVAKKRQVHGLKPSLRWSRLVWTNYNDKHGQPALFHITIALYFRQSVVGGSLRIHGL